MINLNDTVAVTLTKRGAEILNKEAMTKRTKSGKKKKPDLAKNNGEVDTSMGRYYLEQGKVKILNNKGEAV